MNYIMATAISKGKSWASEWKQYLSTKAATYEPTMESHPVYPALKEGCEKMNLICTPEIYQEYVQWAEMKPLKNQSVNSFLSQSVFAHGQHMEYKAAHQLETYSKKNNYTFYNMSIIERISLAAQYVEQR